MLERRSKPAPSCSVRRYVLGILTVSQPGAPQMITRRKPQRKPLLTQSSGTDVNEGTRGCHEIGHDVTSQ